MSNTVKTKRSFCIALAVLTAFSLCACGKNTDASVVTGGPETYSADTPTGSSAPSVTRPVTPEPTVFVKPISVPVYTREELLQFGKPYYDFFWDYELSGWGQDDLELFCKKHPSEAVRLKKGLDKYVVYEDESGHRLYVFFKYDGRRPMLRSGFSLYIKEVHSYSEFSTLNIGDPIDCVAEIDDLADTVNYLFTEKEGSYPPSAHTSFLELGYPVSSVHYLTDGILRIEYDWDYENNKLIIFDMIYSEDYKLPSNYGREMDYYIYPQDLPPQE